MEIILLIALGVLLVLHWMNESTIKRRVAQTKRLVIDECRLELTRKLQKLNAEFLALAADMDFIVEMKDYDARRSRYYNVIAGRYIELYKRVIEAYYEENAPNGQPPRDRAGHSQNQTSANDCTIPKVNVNGNVNAEEEHG